MPQNVIMKDIKCSNTNQESVSTKIKPNCSKIEKFYSKSSTSDADINLEKFSEKPLGKIAEGFSKNFFDVIEAGRPDLNERFLTDDENIDIINNKNDHKDLLQFIRKLMQKLIIRP